MATELKKTGDFLLKSKHHDRPFIADACYKETGSKKPCIIFVHGFKGFKDWGFWNLLAETFASQDFVFIKLNLSHNGTTPEHPVDFADLEAFSENTFSIELDDIGILIDTLENGNLPLPETEIDSKNIHLIGHSRGGGLVLLKGAEDERVLTVTAWAPIHNLKERWPQEVLDQWKKDGIFYIDNSRTKQKMPLKYKLVEDVLNNEDRLNIPRAVQRMDRPILMIHGTKDETLEYSHTVQLAKLSPYVQLEIIEDGTHSFGGKHPYAATDLPDHAKKVLDLTLNFLRA
ncbi:MAG: alpha/beta fold hydrolase [Bacteroidota bacterium]